MLASTAYIAVHFVHSSACAERFGDPHAIHSAYFGYNLK